MQNQLAANAVNAGAFGGAREGVQQAELQNRTLEAMGRANAQGFGTALGAAQRQQQLGMAAGQQLGNLGAGQQQMAQADSTAISSTSLRCCKTNTITTTIRALSKSRVSCKLICCRA